MAHTRQHSVAQSVSHPHSVSLKVLRLSRPALITATQIPGTGPLSSASKPYPSAPISPYTLTPLLQLPPAFGAAYIGTTFSCTLCANNELPATSPLRITDVSVSAELQTPVGTVPLALDSGPEDDQHTEGGGDVLPSAQTVQRIVRHELKEDGQHVLAVTVAYTERSSVVAAGDVENPGTRRTFKKLYQFSAQPAIGVRTKIGEFKRGVGKQGRGRRRFVLEAQLENLTETTVVLRDVGLVLADGLSCRSLNGGAAEEKVDGRHDEGHPLLAPQDVLQVAFVLEQKSEEEELGVKRDRVMLAQVKIDWRGPMGEKGELITGWLGAKART